MKPLRCTRLFGVGWVAGASAAALLAFVGTGCTTGSAAAGDQGVRGVEPGSSARLVGLWHVEHVEVVLDDGGSGAGTGASLDDLAYRSERTSALLRDRSLMILYRLEAGGRYTRTVCWSSVPGHERTERGRWVLDTGGVVRVSRDADGASLFSEATVVHLDESVLVLRSAVPGAGASTIVGLRRGAPATGRAWDELLASGAGRR